MDQPQPRRFERLVELLAGGDVAPGAHDFDRIAPGVAQDPQLVADPALAAVLAAKAVLAGEMASLHQLLIFLQHARLILRVHAAGPEVRSSRDIRRGRSRGAP